MRLDHYKTKHLLSLPSYNTREFLEIITQDRNTSKQHLLQASPKKKADPRKKVWMMPNIVLYEPVKPQISASKKWRPQDCVHSKK